MSTNCLVTKLKGIVDNDNLERFAALKITIHHKDNVTKMGCFNAFLNNLGKIEVDGDGYLLNILDQNLGQEYNVTNADQIYFSNPTEGQTYHAYLYKKYNLQAYNDGANPISIDVSALNYSDTLTQFTKRYESDEDKGTFKPFSTIRDMANDSTKCEVDMSNAGAALRILKGYYTIPQSVFNTVAPNLTEFTMQKSQSYTPDAALITCAIENPITARNIPFTWGTKTGSITAMVNVNLGDKVDACLKNLANLTAGANTIVLWGTSNHATDAEVQAAIHTLINDKGVTNLQINGTLVSY